MRRNIALLTLIKLCKWFMLYMPVVKLYYAENQLDDFDLFWLHAVYSGVIFLVEIPSGYLADRWGRVRSIRIGLLFGLAGFTAYAFGTGVWGFLVAEIALGVGEAFISGSDSALLYDSLLQQNRQDRYLQLEGRITGMGNFAEAAAGLTVTLLAFSEIRNYYVVQSVLLGAAFILALGLVEPVLHSHRSEVNAQSILHIVRHTLWHNRTLSRYVFFSSIVGFASLAMAWFAQIFIYDAGVLYSYFGIIWAVLNGMVALGSMNSHRIDRWWGNRLCLYYILAFLSGGYLLAAYTISPVGIVCLLVFYFVRGTAHPILKDRINQHTHSQVRATVLSVRSLIIRLLFAVLGPLLGVLTERISLSFALLLAGISILVSGTVVLFLMHRSSRSAASGKVVF